MPGRRNHHIKSLPPVSKYGIPLLDSGKSGSPFAKETTWTLQQHDPLPPFGKGYRIEHRRGPRALAWVRANKPYQSVYCINNPPPGREPPAHAPRLKIELGDELRPFLIQGAHVISCKVVDGAIPPVRLESDPSSTLTVEPKVAPGAKIIAKIFDPLYYNHSGHYDVIEQADMDYCRETAAYRHLMLKGVDGKILPAFYGSFTLDVPLTEQQIDLFARKMGANHRALQGENPSRRVRLILMEAVEGQSMSSHVVFDDVKTMLDGHRLNAIASVFEAYAELYHYGIAHGDLAPRNVMVVEYMPDDPTLRPDPNSLNPRNRNFKFHRFVDLGLAYIMGQPQSEYEGQQRDETRPRNPIRLFWNAQETGASNMYFWVPEDMRNTSIFQRWMLAQWYGDARYEPIGAVPEPVKSDKDWELGIALSNEKWPAVRGKAIAFANGGKLARENLRRIFMQYRRPTVPEDWRLPAAASKVIAAQPGTDAGPAGQNGQHNGSDPTGGRGHNTATSEYPKGFW